jgi:hypothetical protein
MSALELEKFSASIEALSELDLLAIIAELNNLKLINKSLKKEVQQLRWALEAQD